MQTEHKLESHSNVIPRIEVVGSTPDYWTIFNEYIRPNKPFLLCGDVCTSKNGTRWPVFDDWLEQRGDGLSTINFDHIIDNYGEEEVPVANCDEEQYGAHTKTDMKFSDYLKKLKSDQPSGCLYLKDYHFMRLHADKRIYDTPSYFTSDWLNEYCTDTQKDDYRFVYMGPKGSWTPFHADVLRSFSWSANITGRKLWIIYPPGAEKLLMDSLGNLPFDVSKVPYSTPEHASYKHRLEVTQESGETIFIPSGWHHQVHNLETTLSINHNWFNGCNIDRCWHYLQQTLVAVKKEIDDCRDMEDWYGHCQVLLKAYLGFNYSDLFTILIHITEKRLSPREACSEAQITFDLSAIQNTLTQMLVDDDVNRITDIVIEPWINKITQGLHSKIKK